MQGDRHTTRPVFVPDAIPATLRDVPRWVAWRYQTRDGKPTKVPYDARSGRRAAVDRPASWSAFADALAACQTADYAGLGIVLNGDGLVALDYDDCIAGDGTIAPDVLADLAELGTYAERSPSGRGVRAFVVGDLPDGATGRRRGDFEVYASARYVTVTGDRIDGMPETVADGGDALAAVYAARIGNHAPDAPPEHDGNQRRADFPVAAATADDETIVQRLLTIPQAAALYGGDTSRHDGDASRADSALASHAVYCGAQDAAQLWRVLAASGLARPKWSRDDYRERTAAYAFRVTRDRYDQRNALAVLTVSGVRSHQEQPQDFGAHPDVAIVEPSADELRRLRFELDRTRAERDRAVAERDHANGTIRDVVAIIRNGNLGAARLTGVALVIMLRSRGADDAPDAMHQTCNSALGSIAGCNAATASRHVRQIAALPDSPLRRELRVVETIDRETGELQSRQWSFIGMTTPTVAAFADRLAASQTETRHGGARERLACPDHPDAGALKRTAWSLECADCARVLAVGETVQRVKPDALADPERETRLQDAIGSNSPAPVVAVSLPEQDAIGIADADFDVADFEVHDRLHDATGMQPLFPPLPSEIAARYAR